MSNDNSRTLLTAREIHGPYVQLLVNLQGEDGKLWLFALKKFLRKENPWSRPKDTTHLHHLQTVTLGATSGAVTIAQSASTFPGHLDPNFKKWGTDKSGADTGSASLDIYEMTRDGMHHTLFGSLVAGATTSYWWRPLCVSQGQIVEFCQTHKDKLRQDGSSTFFLFAVEGIGAPFVARVSVGDAGLEGKVHHFDNENVWNSDRCLRLVAPQLAPST